MAQHIAWFVVATLFGLVAPLNAQIRTTVVIQGLTNPVAVVADPTERDTYVIVEQRGLVRIARNGVVLDEPFLDLRDVVSTGGERGLLGIAFAPDYSESRRFFVNFTNRNGDTVIARFLRSDDRHRADRDSRFDLMWPSGRRYVEQPFSNHNGGHLAFGPDGYMYVGLGDGGSAGDPQNHSQRADSLLGKMLRIDVNVGNDDVRGYRVPDDNPFIGNDAVRALDEIWSFGLRNPWRYSFDDSQRGGTSALLIADVGQNAREEINFEPAGRSGRNYGWRLREGRQGFEDRTTPAFLPLTEPIHDYGRAIGASITGGFVYRGAALDPSFGGRYFYADFVSGRVFSIGLHLTNDGEARADDEREHTAQLGGRESLGMVSSFAEDHAGELLVLNYSAGTVSRVVPDLSVVPAAPVASGTFEDGRAALSWTPSTEGAETFDFVVERQRESRTVERFTVERPNATVSTQPGDCFRIRGRARGGPEGPPSVELCNRLP